MIVANMVTTYGEVIDQNMISRFEIYYDINFSPTCMYFVFWLYFDSGLYNC